LVDVFALVIPGLFFSFSKAAIVERLALG
jgi:hypothetical protein